MIKYACSFLLIALTFGCHKSQDVTETAPFVNVVPLHSKFNINLPENHTTGYMWQLQNGYNEKTVDYMNSVWHGNEKGVVFNFETKAKGTALLELKLIKYQDTMDIKKFWIQVK